MDKKRAPNWKESEEMFLMELIKDHRDVIEGKFSATLTLKKTSALEEISKQMNRWAYRSSTITFAFIIKSSPYQIIFTIVVCWGFF